MVSRVDLWSMIVAFPGHPHFLFIYGLLNPFYCRNQLSEEKCVFLYCTCILIFMFVLSLPHGDMDSPAICGCGKPLSFSLAF